MHEIFSRKKSTSTNVGVLKVSQVLRLGSRSYIVDPLVMISPRFTLVFSAKDSHESRAKPFGDQSDRLCKLQNFYTAEWTILTCVLHEIGDVILREDEGRTETDLETRRSVHDDHRTRPRSREPFRVPFRVLESSTRGSSRGSQSSIPPLQWTHFVSSPTPVKSRTNVYQRELGTCTKSTEDKRKVRMKISPE